MDTRSTQRAVGDSGRKSPHLNSHDTLMSNLNVTTVWMCVRFKTSTSHSTLARMADRGRVADKTAWIKPVLCLLLSIIQYPQHPPFSKCNLCQHPSLSLPSSPAVCFYLTVSLKWSRPESRSYHTFDIYNQPNAAK